MKGTIHYAIIGSIALTAGAGCGFFIKRVIMKPDQEIVGFNPEACKIDGDALIKKIEAEGGSQAAVDKYPAVDIANYAMEKYKRYDNSVSFCYGLAKTVVDQEIRNAQIRSGDTYFEESISKSSMVGIGKRMIQKGMDADVTFFNEKSASDVSISGDVTHTTFQDPITMTAADYKTAYGRQLPDMFIYICHELTVLEGTVTPKDGNYEVVLELDPNMGGYNYRYQMQSISKLDSLPVFEYITLTFTLDSTLNLKHVNAHEKYKATMMGISPDIENTLDYDYFPGTSWEIPNKEQDIDYAALKEMIK